MKTKLLDLMGPVILSLGAATLLLVTLSASAAPSGVSPVTWTDNFDSPSLSRRWSWMREDASHWSLAARPGMMQITTQAAIGFAVDTTKNVLVQNAPVSDFEIRTRLFFTPTQNIQGAGLLVYQDDSNGLSLSHGYCDSAVPFIFCEGDAIFFHYVSQGIPSASKWVTTTVGGGTYLRLIRHGSVYTGYVSLNGTDWTWVGTHATSEFTPTRIGLSASNLTITGIGVADEIPASFDYFQVEDNSYHLFLPLIAR